MSDFRIFNVQQFEKYITSLCVLRMIKRIQLHHTYSPSYKQFTGDNHSALQSAMRSYHIKTNGWSDIAQHFTIFPDGVIVSGRSIEMVPAGIKGANTGAISIECLGNFDVGADTMTDAQKEAIIKVTRCLIKKFGLDAKNSVTYHSWWTSTGKELCDYIPAKSCKTCPGTAFFGGNTREAFEKNLLPLIGEEKETLKSIDKINDIIWELMNKGIVTDGKLWIEKCQSDKNVYYLCKKMANYLRGTL